MRVQKYNYFFDYTIIIIEIIQILNFQCTGSLSQIYKRFGASGIGVSLKRNHRKGQTPAAVCVSLK